MPSMSGGRASEGMVGDRIQLATCCFVEPARALGPIDRQKAAMILKPLARLARATQAESAAAESDTSARVRFGGANIMLTFGNRGLWIFPFLADVITGHKYTCGS
jgi:hypothetical protein